MNNPQKILLQLDENYTLLYDEKNTCTPYNAAYKYDKEKNSWANGHYASSIKGAILQWLDYIGCDAIKDRNQLLVERKYGLTYDRMSELATQFKDGLIEDDEEQAMIYFDETCEMTDKEKEYFGIMESEEE